MSDTQTLIEMLSYMRPHDSDSEIEFCERFIKVNPHKNMNDMAYVVSVGKSDTLFSCHVDTVHNDDGMQRVASRFGRYNTLFKRDGEPLGADDGAGVWLLLEMIKHGVNGTYVFHRGEEVGGVGSRYLATHHKKFLQRHKRAIAFDRRGDCDVITHQMKKRGCGDDFAKALSTQLNRTPDMNYRPCERGMFTDTANYFGIIDNCTNVSVGYMDEHTDGESLDLDVLFRLRDACVELQWDALPA